MLESSYYKEKGIKLRIYFDRGWVITGDSDFYPGDCTIAGWMGISIEDYKEMLKNFNGKQIKKDPSRSHFSFKSDAEQAIEWINSVIIANKLAN